VTTWTRVRSVSSRSASSITRGGSRSTTVEPALRTSTPSRIKVRSTGPSRCSSLDGGQEKRLCPRGSRQEDDVSRSPPGSTCQGKLVPLDLLGGAFHVHRVFYGVEVGRSILEPQCLVMRSFREAVGLSSAQRPAHRCRCLTKGRDTALATRFP
jgi:hypothetical protein